MKAVKPSPAQPWLREGLGWTYKTAGLFLVANAGRSTKGSVKNGNRYRYSPAMENTNTPPHWMSIGMLISNKPASALCNPRVQAYSNNAKPSHGVQSNQRQA